MPLLTTVALNQICKGLHLGFRIHPVSMVFGYIPNKIFSDSEMVARMSVFSYIHFSQESFPSLSQR